ncbi:MAG: helix-turn-helix domain-containing protein [Thermomicrobiales bacterium]
MTNRRGKVVHGSAEGPDEAAIVESPLGSWIRARRTANGMSQRELADRAGLSRSYLCDIERGRGTRPSLHSMDRLAMALGVDRVELLEAAGILASGADPRQSHREGRLVTVFRGLSDGAQESLERYARFLLSDEQRWVQPRFSDGFEEAGKPRLMVQTGPTLFDNLG